MSQGEYPRMIVSPIKVCAAEASASGLSLRLDSTAQWDTGSDYCMISRELVEKLRLTPRGDVSVNCVEGNRLKRKFYEVDILLPNGIYFEEIPAIVDDGLRETGVDFLVGMYVINELDFTLTHKPEGETVLSISYPGDRLVDFCRGHVEFL